MTDKTELIKRYIFLLAGLFVNGLGVSFITKAGLGTSPITSIPYTLSLGFTPTVGMFTLVFNIFLVILQVILLRRNFQLQNLLQLPIIALFSFFIARIYAARNICYESCITYSRLFNSRFRCVYGNGRKRCNVAW